MTATKRRLQLLLALLEIIQRYKSATGKAECTSAADLLRWENTPEGKIALKEVEAVYKVAAR